MKYVLIGCGLLLSLHLHAQPEETFAAGLLYEDEYYDAQPRQAAESGSKADLPASVDLTPYTPEVRHQGYIFSCVGWAVGYGALSTQRAVLNQCTDKTVITRNAHSALFLYNQIKSEDCGKGSRMTDALQFLVDNGDCLASHFDFDVNNCEQLPDSSVKNHAKRYAIEDYLALFGSGESPGIKVLRVKKVLAQKKPVVVGMSVLRNFYDLRNAVYWHPELGNTAPAGGHAMVVVGFDDHKGAFRLMNSWGKNWGDQGYIWIKYKDFGNFCKYAFALYLVAPEKLNQQPLATQVPTGKKLLELSGRFQFRYFDGWQQQSGEAVFETSEAFLQGQTYQLKKQDWLVGQRFQLLVQATEQEQYLYVFSVDAKQEAHFHWPRQAGLNERFENQNESPLFVAGQSELIIPGPQKVLRIEHPGDDFLVVLFSKRKIDTVQQLAERLCRMEGDFTENLFKILGKFAISRNDITYLPHQIGFDAASRSEGFIVPLVLKVSSH
ncbi:MAG: hypothetical protein HUU01_06680 [Saprospiraceae bacterium]|nr:hypothetical protein [Saprospiraceae bacterium]